MGRDSVGGDGLLGVLEGGWGELVVGPAAILAHRHEAGVAEGLEVEGEQGLAAVEIREEIADALLAGAQQVQDAEPTRVGKGVKQPGVPHEAFVV